ncbi:MAG TPA: ABC transporter permease [Candidatus Acidoferrales bacterium]|nr:ABC transporter permease [Candidatus Acidoferrales bacterium]
MKFSRTWALVERDMRKFFRSPALMMTSMIFPLVQLVVLGYAFGGKIRGAKIAVVDQDHSVQSRRVREAFDGIETGPRTFRAVEYDSLQNALNDLRAGFVRGVVDIPPDFSLRYYQHNRPRIALSEDNTDQFTSSSLQAAIQQCVSSLNMPTVQPRLASQVDLDVVEVYPYVPYVQYLLAGTTAMSIFIVAMIGGGITFIDDKSRGLHEGYLLTPIHKSELVGGLISAGAIKGLMSGMVLVVVGGLIAGIPHLWDPVRLLYLAGVVLVASVAMISFMFLLMVRVDDPLVPRAIFGVLNTLLFFPSGAVYPTEGFPAWLRWISVVDPFTYTVHALQNLTLKGTGIEGIYKDVLVLAGFSIAMIAGCMALFKRQL